MELSVVPVYQSEVVPAPVRGFVVGTYQLAIGVSFKQNVTREVHTNRHRRIARRNYHQQYLQRNQYLGRQQILEDTIWSFLRDPLRDSVFDLVNPRGIIPPKLLRKCHTNSYSQVPALAPSSKPPR